MSDDRERRSFLRPLEVRADQGAMTLTGYAAVFGQATDLGPFREQIAPGAFSDTLRRSDVRALFNHDASKVLGRVSAGTLRLTEDATGLSAEIDLPDTTDGRDVRELVRRGDVSGMSFGFRVLSDRWDFTDDDAFRTIEAVELYEVSAVTFPAYDGTSIALRSRDQALRERRTQNFNAARLRLRLKTDLDLMVRSKASTGV
ncbi:HK97 family phage prohead protease [Microvirga tunisiensis]|uniref:HK97 family phage prohead protease n=1 Tax=Pannonibacter tanglangensis TaxID=2750084 RepID=A0A7X5F2R2_9HYPH|nr:HK97 family phage prohead protease [Pannonibacter sp. XCT-53]NBN78686.1 HK97 family phage prohead protease [Pannonibacter sp. XCT-53]